MTEKFHFTHEGDDYAIPYLSNLKAGLRSDILVAYAKVKEQPWLFMEAMFAIAAKESPETLEAMRDLDGDVFDAMVKDWANSTPGVSGK